MRTPELYTIADIMSSDIIYGLQIDRVDKGEYVVSGCPSDYYGYVREHSPVPLVGRNLSRIVQYVGATVESYINGILRVGEKPIRYGQTASEIYSVAVQWKNDADSLEELLGMVAGALKVEVPPEMEPLVEAIYSGDMNSFVDVWQSLSPGVQVPAMPGVEYGTEVMLTTPTPGVPGVPASALTPISQKRQNSSIPIRFAQEETEEEFDYLNYYTKGTEPGSREETELLINLDPLQISTPSEEAPTEVSEYLETVSLEEAEEEEVAEEEEEEAKETFPSLRIPEPETVFAPNVPAWWRGFWGIMTSLPEYKYDELRERLGQIEDFRAEAEEDTFVENLHDSLTEIGETFDISTIADPEQRALARSRARQEAFDKVWAPYALMHAFMVAGMTAVRPFQRMFEGWLDAHFPPEFGERFRELVRLSSGGDMEERFPNLLQAIYWWRDPAGGEGHGTDPTQWDQGFVAQIPETIQIDTNLSLGDDPRTSIDLGTIAVDHPVYRTYIRRPKKPEKPISYAPGELRPDDPRSVALEFEEKPS